MNGDMKDKNYKNKKLRLHSLLVEANGGEHVALQRFQHDCDFVIKDYRYLDRYPSQSQQRSWKHFFVDARNVGGLMSHFLCDYFCQVTYSNTWNDLAYPVHQLDLFQIFDLLYINKYKRNKRNKKYEIKKH